MGERVENKTWKVCMNRGLIAKARLTGGWANKIRLKIWKQVSKSGVVV